jgi:hypothetical protein
MADRRVPKPVYVLTVRDCRSPDDAPTSVRLRRVIKTLFRHYGFAPDSAAGNAPAP